MRLSLLLSKAARRSNGFARGIVKVKRRAEKLSCWSENWKEKRNARNRSTRIANLDIWHVNFLSIRFNPWLILKLLLPMQCHRYCMGSQSLPSSSFFFFFFFGTLRDFSKILLTTCYFQLIINLINIVNSSITICDLEFIVKLLWA